MLPHNLDLLGACIDNPEPIYDPDYQKEYVIISRDPCAPNTLMRANRTLLELITTYGVNARMGNHGANEKVVAEMVGLLETPDINTSEFTSFWECCDVSYSVFRKLTPEEKTRFLHRITAEYIRRRHDLYSSHGYTATTLQVKADSFAHKRTGEQGMQKVVRILGELNIPLVQDDTEALAASSNKSWLILPDKQHRAAFGALVDSRRLKLAWSRNHKGKLPDYAIKVGPHLFIAEHKHMKELGGGQDKQIVEISEFVSQSEDALDVHYVAFLDGILFNRIFARDARGKVARQRDEIRAALRRHPANYFVNSHGFDVLMRTACGASG